MESVLREIIGVIDAGVGNVSALCRSLLDVGASVQLIETPKDIKGVDALVLPGVGSFDHGVQSIKGAGLWEPIRERVLDASLPILGICLGMQLLGDRSQEGQEKGLGFIEGEIKHIGTLPGAPSHFRIPNMGWAQVEASSHEGAKFLAGTDGQQRYYFVHSYAFVPKKGSDKLLEMQGFPALTAAVKKNNICGFQFHPEKSHRFGRQALSAWVREEI